MKLALKLTGNAALPRALDVTLSASGTLYAQAFGPFVNDNVRTIAYARDPLKDCRIDMAIGGGYSLWIGHTAFDLTAAEAADVHAALTPFGLRSGFELPATEAVQ